MTRFFFREGQKCKGIFATLATGQLQTSRALVMGFCDKRRMVSPNMKTENDLHNLRGKSTEELCQWTTGFKEGTAPHLLGKQELERRSQGPALRAANRANLIALGSAVLSLAAVVISIVK